MQVDWNTLGKIALASGVRIYAVEEKQLTQEEIEQVNKLITEAYRKLEIVNVLLSKAQERFVEL